MADPREERIDSLVVGASRLTGEVRRKFLDLECAGDVELRSAVETRLLAEYSESELPEHRSGPLTGAEREAFLDRHCAAKPELRESLRAFFVESEHRSRNPHISVSAFGPVSDAEEDGRNRSSSIIGFEPGTVVADRYCLVSLLGKGGMGEVFLAFDLKLEQHVALKFLTVDPAQDQAAVALFLDEVRVARQVSHPNVARVHDIGEVDGRPFLTMEFVDGEDLSRLLRRIGRLPKEKATEIAQQICAGMDAAHAKGVVHRDIKPANIMLDGDGQVRVTDFGLAAIRNLDGHAGPVAGTPAYMAPELFRGEAASTASDIYAVGCVLYEMYCGQPVASGDRIQDVIRRHNEQKLQLPSVFVRDLDEETEACIMACLQRDPARRPKSAGAVALGLPGGNPLEAILAAGRTPSADLLRAAGLSSPVSRRLAGGLVAALFVVLAITIWLARGAQFTALVPGFKDPAVLLEACRDCVEALGLPRRTVDEEIRFTVDNVIIDTRAKKGVKDLSRLYGDDPAPISVHYYRSPARLTQAAFSIQRDVQNKSLDPASWRVGSAHVKMTCRGKLHYAIRVPESNRGSVATRTSTPDSSWGSWFARAGLDESEWQTTVPSWYPSLAVDERLAWAPPPSRPELAGTTVEAGTQHGEPVYFRVYRPADRNEGTSEAAPLDVAEIGVWRLLLFVGAFILSGWVAYRNLRAGRCDVRGTVTVMGLFVFSTTILGAISERNAPDTGWWIGASLYRLSKGLQYGAIVGVNYLAIEPYIRRFWPDKITTWVRALRGDFREPRVALDTLIGLLCGAVLAALLFAASAVLGARPDQIGSVVYGSTVIYEITSLNHPIVGAAGSMLNCTLLQGLFSIVLFTIFRLCARRTWIAILIFGFGFGMANRGDADLLGTIVICTVMLCAALPMSRFGVYPMLVAWMVWYTLRSTPLTLDSSLWFSSHTVWVLVTLGVIAAFAFHRSTVQGPPRIRRGA